MFSKNGMLSQSQLASSTNCLLNDKSMGKLSQLPEPLPIPVNRNRQQGGYADLLP